MASTRATGLISGIDTDAMVKALTASQQNKIDNLRKDNTKATWQQTEYRTIISKLNDFKNKYFSNLNPLTNLSSAATLSQYTSSITSKSTGVTSSAVTATATGSLSNTAHSISVQQLAAKASYQGGASPVKVESSMTADAMLTNVNSALDTAGGGSGEVRFAASYDGTTKAIDLKGVKQDDGSYRAYASAEELQDDIQAQLDSAFGAGKVNARMEKSTDSSGSTTYGALSFTNVESGHSFGIGNIKGGNQNAVQTLGFDDLSYTTLDTSQTLDKLGLANGDLSGTVTFNINGTDFAFDAASTTMQDVFNKVNESSAGVRMYYSSLSNAVVMESKSTGASNQISFEDTSHGTNGLMSSLFGASSSTAFDAAVEANKNLDDQDKTFHGKAQAGQDARFTVDGVSTSRSSNSFEIEGVAYTLNAVTGNETLDVKFTQDTSKIKELIVDFVKDYNALVGYSRIRENFRV